MGIPRMATISRIMATTDHIRTIATILGLHSTGTAGIAIITATTVIIGTIIGTKLT